MNIPALPTTKRILHGVPCTVCEDHSSGKHYGVHACDGCAGFFKRTVRCGRVYHCKTGSTRTCAINKSQRNQCRSCRMNKCLDVGMNPDAVQHERGPRASTINRQIRFANESRSSVISYLTPVVPKLAVKPPPPLLTYPHLPSHNNPYQFNGISLPFHPFFIRSTFPPVPVICEPSIAADIGITSEIAAKVLFLNVKWANDLLKYVNLDMATQQHLLIETWKDLFVLGSSQFMYPLNLMVFVRTKNINIDMAAVQLLQNTISAIGIFGLDSVEYTYIRAMLLFKKRPERQEGDAVPGNGTVSSIIADQHDLNKQVLEHYVGVRYPHMQNRMRSLETLLPVVRQVSSMVIVDLFFRSTIGNIAIESIICDMYQTT